MFDAMATFAGQALGGTAEIDTSVHVYVVDEPTPDGQLTSLLHSCVRNSMILRSNETAETMSNRRRARPAIPLTYENKGPAAAACPPTAMPDVRVVSTGSAVWDDADYVRSTLKDVAVQFHRHGATFVLFQGGAGKGADVQARTAATELGWRVETRRPAALVTAVDPHAVVCFADDLKAPTSRVARDVTARARARHACEASTLYIVKQCTHAPSDADKARALTGLMHLRAAGGSPGGMETYLALDLRKG
jgi:hypothetical protein